MLKVGSRLRSQVSEVAVVVVVARRDSVIECGGLPMVDIGTIVDSSHFSTTDGEILLGKRYVTDDSLIELLCTNGGAGQLVADGVAMTIKDSKSLPSSD
jgi:hypothetical protein